MGNHLACIGVSIEDENLERVLMDLATKGKARRLRSGCSLFRWEDSSGAGLAIYIEDGAVQRVTPFFQGRTWLSARLAQWVNDPNCRYCDILMLEALDEHGELLYPLAIEVEDIEAVHTSLKLQSTARFQITGFAETVESWTSAQDFDRSQPGEGIRFGPEFFIPSGTFTGPDIGESLPTARASIGGTVLSADSLVNSATGAGFLHLTVRSYGGEYDVVVEPAALPRTPEVGWIIRAHCWMVGRALIAN